MEVVVFRRRRLFNRGKMLGSSGGVFLGGRGDARDVSKRGKLDDRT